ncbi:MAG TPA: hypothetical protein K8V56_10115 [Sporosarcina psychrophila]|uniref:DUF3221 domain-containing protein n=1 Tax=Sporosarcina psychrophila TaxID=1476 RepID=A0A921KDD3_SPOPS|nr:hypothetical protein [Sporosarcina psychrophila]
MRKVVLYLALTILSTFLVVGCSDIQNAENNTEKDSYDEVRKIAWDFVVDKGWNDTAKENWQSAKVTKVVVENNYELLDDTHEAEEALSVSFEDKENVVVGTPLILIDTNTNKVIGYMLSE